MEKLKIEKELKKKCNDVPLSVLLSEIKEAKYENTNNSKVVFSKFYRLKNYPVYSHFKSILRF